MHTDLSMDDSTVTERKLPLSLLIELLARGDRMNEEFVRRFSRWFDAHGAHLHLAPLDRLGLVDVVLTFRMKHTVSLVATGRYNEFPGEIMVTFDEDDFPFVTVILDKEPRAVPYLVCTLDYAVAGRRVRVIGGDGRDTKGVPPGSRGVALVFTTMGDEEHLRVRLDAAPDAPVNVPLDAVEIVEEE
jgi:hypothetical protein